MFTILNLTEMKTNFESILSDVCKVDMQHLPLAAEKFSECLLNALQSFSMTEFKSPKDRLIASSIIANISQLDTQICQFGQFIQSFVDEVCPANVEPLNSQNDEKA